MTRFLSLLAVLIVSLSLMAFGLAQEKEGVLRHVVSFKFKARVSDQQIEEVEKAFRDLERKIPEIRSFEMGTNVSPENLNKGFTHGFILTFGSAKDRDAYLVHPDHEDFAEMVGPLLEDVFVIDFWAK